MPQTLEGAFPHNASLPAAGLLQGPSLLRLLGRLALCCWQTAWALDAHWGQAAVPGAWEPAWRLHSSGEPQMQPWCCRQQCGRWHSCPSMRVRKQGWPGLLVLQGAFVHSGAAADKQALELPDFMLCHTGSGYQVPALVRCVEADVACCSAGAQCPRQDWLHPPQQGLLLIPGPMKKVLHRQACR